MANRSFNYHQIKEQQASARIELEKLDLVFTSLGWLHKDAIDFGLRTGAIEKRGNDYVLIAEDIEEETTTGYRGRNPIVERKTKRDISKIKAFFALNDEIQKKQSQQEYVIDEEMRGLIESLGEEL